jgi:hypothetical protein
MPIVAPEAEAVPVKDDDPAASGSNPNVTLFVPAASVKVASVAGVVQAESEYRVPFCVVMANAMSRGASAVCESAVMYWIVNSAQTPCVMGVPDDVSRGVQLVHVPDAQMSYG